MYTIRTILYSQHSTVSCIAGNIRRPTQQKSSNLIGPLLQAPWFTVVTILEQNRAHIASSDMAQTALHHALNG